MTTPAEKVRVSVAMNPPILLLDYSHQVTLSGTAVVRVEAPSSTKKNHAPIDLIMLINISNSMSWPAASSPTTETPSTRLDLLKKAMKFMSRQLDDGDRLAIVAFNDQVVKEHSTGLLEMSGSGRMAIEKKVDGLVAKGDTAFKPSLEYAVKLLDERADKKRVGFIILISDGLDKQVKWSDESIGATDPVRALLRKYPVHTLGLCKGDDPKSLHYIAEISYGTYSSVDLADGGKQITEALAVCVAGFKTVVAVDASVDIRSSSLQVTRIDAGGYTIRSPSSGGIYVGTLYAGEVKDFVAHFSYRTGTHGRGYHTTLNGINAVVTCRPSATTSITTDTCSVALPLHVADTAALPANPCPPHPVALQQTVRFKAADLLVNVLKEFHVLKEEAGGRGDDPVLQAVAASSLGKKWAEFKKSDESWKQAPGNLLDLGGIDGDMDAVVGALKRGSGVGCAYSWLSSHQMQRATTAAGLPAPADHAGRFRTPAMAAMVREARRQMAEEASAKDAGTWVVGRRAAELLDGINRRFELWCKVDHDLPPSLHLDDGGDLAAGLRGDINRARQHHIYLAADHAIKQWRSFLASVRKRMSMGRTCRRIHDAPQSVKHQNPVSAAVSIQHE